jgi:hypothetical protein
MESMPDHRKCGAKCNRKMTNDRQRHLVRQRTVAEFARIRLPLVWPNSGEFGYGAL